MAQSDSLIRYEEREDLMPLCPSCHAPLGKIFYKRARALVVGRRIYFCPECLHALPVSYEQ